MSHARPRLAVISWYGVGKRDAGERVRLEGVTRNLGEHFDVLWLIFDPSETAEDAYERPPRDVGVRYSMPKSAYIAATIRNVAIEQHYPASVRGLRAWVNARLDAFRPDVILANQPFAWGTLSERWHDRTVLDTHNVNSARLTRMADSLGARPEALLLKRQASLSKRLEQRYVLRSAETWVVSEDDASHLSSSPIQSVRTIPNGCDVVPTSRPAPIPTSGPLRLLFLGSLGYSANIDALRRLIEWCKSVSSDIEVTVAGSGDSTAAAQIATADKRFKVVGRVDDARSTMQAHHALVAPHSQGGGSRIKILEALGTRTPIIASRVATEGSGAEANLHYLLAENGPQFAAQISRVRDHSIRKSMTESGFEVASRFDWEKLGGQIVPSLRNIAEQSGR